MNWTNVTFVNFQDNATRTTGAISYLLYTSFGTRLFLCAAMLRNRFPKSPPGVWGKVRPAELLTLRFYKFREIGAEPETRFWVSIVVLLLQRFTEDEETGDDWFRSLCSSKPTGRRSSLVG